MEVEKVIIEFGVEQNVGRDESEGRRTSAEAEGDSEPDTEHAVQRDHPVFGQFSSKQLQQVADAAELAVYFTDLLPSETSRIVAACPDATVLCSAAVANQERKLRSV